MSFRAQRGISRSAAITLLLALPVELSAQTPLRHDVSNPALAPLPVCQDSIAVAGDTTGIGLVPPQVRVLIVPPFPVPKAVRGTTAEVRILVNVVGGMDSIVVTGMADSGYVKKLRESILRVGKFQPAHMNGCRRAGWIKLQLTFNP